MSFFNYGSSPANKSDGSKPQPEGSSGDFNMFGSGGTGSESFFGGADDKYGGSFLGTGSGPDEGGTSFFGSGGFGTPCKLEDQKPATSSFRPPGDLSSTTPAKKMKIDSTAPQSALSNTSPSISPTDQQSKQPAGPSPSLADNWGAPPTARPGIPQSQSSVKRHQQASPQDQMYKQGSTGFTQSHTNSQGYSQAQPKGTDQAPTLNQQQEQTFTDQTKATLHARSNEEDDDEDIPADALLKELIEMQKQQLTEFLPLLRDGEEKSSQILDSAGLVLKDIDNYSEKLSGIKQQYCSRLSQVSSFLRMIPKMEQ